MKRPLILLIVLAIFACKKKTDPPDPIKPEDKAKAAALIEFLQKDELQLKKYYSEVPIDYIDTDQVVKSETDLWPYVSSWLKDDTYSFQANGEVKVNQNSLKVPTDSTAVLTKQYAVKADEQGVAFDFLGHEYQKLSYRLINFTDTNLVVSATWNGKTVISDFRVVQ